MSLTVGTRLGAYEVLAPLGAGGMGDVYRVRDTRLQRVAAMKVLRADVAEDRVRLSRFEQEARAASSLNHPNIVTIYDVGSHDSLAYIAMEWVDGRTLREILGAGPLAPRRVLELGAQIADGLAKAHAAGIVHRDLKPENVMVTRDGFAKIVDFGLAKLAPASSPAFHELPTVAETAPGTVLGTVGYMSPEQASGGVVDFRSDQFSLGAILYELAVGRRAFAKATAAQTLAAIIQDEPEPIASLNPKVPAPLRWTIERCLAKEPERRFASSEDLARDLATLRDRLPEASSVSGSSAVAAPSARGRGRGLLAAAFAAAVAATALVTRRLGEAPPPSFQQMTFRRGYVQSARFVPGSRAVVYAASWDGEPLNLFQKLPDSAESAPLALPPANVLAVSGSGELALALDCRLTHLGVCAGMLAHAPMLGGAPREVAPGVEDADFAPDGELAVVSDVMKSAKIELPPGHVLVQSPSNVYISYARVSPKGDRVAYLEHPDWDADDAAVAVVDRSGARRVLTGVYASARGLAWSPSGDEVWFTASEKHAPRALFAVTLSGRVRVVHRSAAVLTLLDVARDGRVLLAREEERTNVLAARTGGEERDLSWLDHSAVGGISPDGKNLLLVEEGTSFSGITFGVRTLDGSPVVPLGEGFPLGFSPDGRSVLSWGGDATGLTIVPVGPGEPHPLKLPGLELNYAFWSPDGNVIVHAREPGRPNRGFLVNPATGERRTVIPEGRIVLRASADGKTVLAADKNDCWYALYPIAGGAPIPTRYRLDPGETFVRASADGRSVFVAKEREVPLPIYRIDLATGERTLWRALGPKDLTGVYLVSTAAMTPDGSVYAYTYRRRMNDLFLVEGLR